MLSIKIKLNKCRLSKYGNYPLVFQLIYQRKKKIIYTPYRLTLSEFDEIHETVIRSPDSKKKLKEIKEINLFLIKKRQELYSFFLKLISNNSEFTLLDCVEVYKQKRNNHNLISFIQNLSEELIKSNCLGTAKAYISTQHSLEHFLQNRPILFSQIDYVLIWKYLSFLKTKNLSQNTICFYLRNFRAIYNKAMNCGLVDDNSNPFKKIPIRIGQTVKRSLSKDDLRKIVSFDAKGNKDMELSRDIFLFGFYARGMSFVDIAFLQRGDISNDTIYYSRRKTNQLIQIAIHAPLQKIINKYIDNKRKYLFPFITDITKSEYEQYRTSLGQQNRNLKKIASILELPIKLTSHMARHSWASIAKEKGITVSIISESLGHNSEKTTDIYLKSFENNIIDNANQMVSEL